MQTEATAFANSVVELLDSQDKRKTVGEKGMAVMRARFGWDAIAQTLEGYLMQIANRK